jgi:hypothetical protein
MRERTSSVTQAALKPNAEPGRCGCGRRIEQERPNSEHNWREGERLTKKEDAICTTKLYTMRPSARQPMKMTLLKVACNGRQRYRTSSMEP